MDGGDNVISLRRDGPFPEESVMYFPVAERLDGWQDKHGDWHVDPSKKKLVRVNDKGKPVVLATVGDGYKKVSNFDLHQYVQSRMLAQFGDKCHDVQVKDSMAYNGRDCYREYVFPSVRCDIPGGGDIAFRLLVGNSYGAKSIQFILGAIDFLCTNGMISGIHEKTVRKHTSGMELQGFDAFLNNSIRYFTKYTETLKKWSSVEITSIHEDAMFEHLVKAKLLSEQHARQVVGRTHTERNARVGRDHRPSLWHLLSALTHYASHGEVRQTGNDHEASTRITRTRSANQIVHEAERFLLAA